MECSIIARESVESSIVPTMDESDGRKKARNEEASNEHERLMTGFDWISPFWDSVDLIDYFHFSIYLLHYSVPLYW